MDSDTGPMGRSDLVAGFVITPHARWELHRRGIDDVTLGRVLIAPDQRIRVRSGREVRQGLRSLGEPPRTYLIRVIVDVDRRPPEVVTAYRTGKIAKYWRRDA
jgi:hypothetical protein